MPARLTIYFSDQPVRTYVAEESGEYLVGRDPGCDIVLDDVRISRRHARLTISEAGGSIEDLASKNGLAVDGKQIERGSLEDTCWLSVGGLIVQYEASKLALRTQDDERSLREATLREHRALAQPGLGVAALVERLLTSFIEMSGTERGFVLLGAGERFDVVASQGLTPEAVARTDFSGSASAVREVLSRGVALVESDALTSGPVSRPSVVRESIRALVCVPLQAAENTLGAVYSDSSRVGKTFGELDVEILTALASHAALAMWASGLKEEIESLARGLPTRVNPDSPGLSPLPGFQSWSAARPEDRVGGSS